MLCFFVSLASAASFTEDLLLSPLEDGRVLAEFHFETTGALDPSNFYLFPKPMGQILHRFGVEEFSMSLTHGVWKHRDWGLPSDFRIENTSLAETGVIGPSGAEIWASFSTGGPDAWEEEWKGLLEALSGIFCASLNSF